MNALDNGHRLRYSIKTSIMTAKNIDTYSINDPIGYPSAGYCTKRDRVIMKLLQLDTITNSECILKVVQLSTNRDVLPLLQSKFPFKTAVYLTSFQLLLKERLLY